MRRSTPLQGGAASTVDCAAICRKRIVITGSLLRPQSQQQKAEQPPELHPPLVTSQAPRVTLNAQAALCSGLL